MAVVCICRGTKSGGRAVAERLAERLGYPILGREVLQEAAAGLGVPAHLLEEKMGDRPSLWGRFSSMRRAYIVAVQAALADRAAGGDLVYHGLTGGLLMKGVPGVFCLRLIAPLENRVRVVRAETGMSAAEARAYIRDLDASRARWVEVMYGEDVMDPALYDLVINLATLTVEGACAIVTKAIQGPELAVTDAVRARLEDFRLACQVKLALAGDPELRALELEAEADDGCVLVTGEAPLRKSDQTGQRIVELARAVSGVRQIRLKVEWFDPYP
jgi:cytidylate kinase